MMSSQKVLPLRKTTTKTWRRFWRKFEHVISSLALFLGCDRVVQVTMTRQTQSTPMLNPPIKAWQLSTVEPSTQPSSTFEFITILLSRFFNFVVFRHISLSLVVNFEVLLMIRHDCCTPIAHARCQDYIDSFPSLARATCRLRALIAFFLVLFSRLQFFRIASATIVFLSPITSLRGHFRDVSFFLSFESATPPQLSLLLLSHTAPPSDQLQYRIPTSHRLSLIYIRISLSSLPYKFFSLLHLSLSSPSFSLSLFSSLK